MNMIVARNVSVCHGTQIALDRVSLGIMPGEIVALLGPNGAGKSSLLRSIALLDPPDIGTIEIDGCAHSFPASTSTKPHNHWPNLTIVFQRLHLWPHLTVRQNIMLGVRASLSDHSHASRLGLMPLMDRRPQQLSGGEQQRVALARALARNPRWLLLDEPTSAQDVIHMHTIISLLQDMRDRGVGIVLATHHIGFAAKVADRFAFMDTGRIVESGNVAGLRVPLTNELGEFTRMMEL